ncbi:homoserine acetyltransferase [Pseudomonas putida]|nr:homoserine acetyltransferase [Pseudomonas putida]
MRRLALFLISLCLALPVLAADAAKPERKEVFGDVTVHYSAFTSSMLQPEVAAATGLVRSKNQGVLNIAVLKASKPAMAVVSGTVKDLTGRSNPLSFKQISDRGAIYYIAQFKIEQAETLTFDLNVETGGVSHKLSFNQEVFPGE